MTLARTIGILVLTGSALTACEAPPSIKVSREAFEREDKVWPLSVGRGEVGCVRAADASKAAALWFGTEDGKVFGLNEAADGEAGFDDIIALMPQNQRDDVGATPNPEAKARFRASLDDLRTAAAEGCAAETAPT